MNFFQCFRGWENDVSLSFICKSCFANTYAGLAKVLSLIVVPFCVPNFIQTFSSAASAKSNEEKVQVPDLRNF